MKKVMLVLMSICLFVACSSDNEENEPKMKTSIVYTQNVIDLDVNVVIGYYKDGLCLKIASLGDIKKGEISKEIFITDPSITEVFVFSDYAAPNGEANKIDETYTIQKNSKNTIEPSKGVKVIGVDKKDKTQYPH